ncbi:hypothetical protein [Kordiimonas sp.]|uniref:hypothetical protein n=1 Tax=Kordiimonas sp. TaxID=1970157 RepID=UPI003A8E13C9
MGSTRRSQTSNTNQIDSRQIHETVNNTELDYELDVDNSQEDSNNGNIFATGNVTLESEGASIAASEAAAASAEAAAKAAEEIFEQAAKAQEAQAKAMAEAAKGNADAAAKLGEEARRLGEGAFDAATTLSGQMQALAEDTGKNVTDTAKNAIDMALSAAKEAMDVATEINADSLSANRDVVADVLAFADEAADGNRESLQDAFKLNALALEESFESTVGGIADQQQKTLLMGLGIVALMGVLMVVAFMVNNSRKGGS